MTTEDWYYPRTEFAESLYITLVKGPSEAISIFAPRRSGKTSFLLNDFAKIAKNNGHRVIYCDFWTVNKPPLVALLELFDQSLGERSIWERIKTFAGDKLGGAKFGIPGFVEIRLREFSPSMREETDNLLKIEWYCRQFAKGDKPAILLFDEFQELVNSEGGRSLIAALRSSINIRSNKILPVFAGSSQHGLHKVFSRRDAPFFQFASPVDMPPLGEDFVKYLAGQAKEMLNVSLDFNSTLELFDRCGRNPYLLKRWVEERANNPDVESDVLLHREIERISRKFGFSEQWQGFNVEKKRVADLLAEDAVQIYHEEGKLVFRAITDVSVEDQESLAEATNELINEGVLDRWNGHWEIADGLFKLWVKLRSKS